MEPGILGGVRVALPSAARRRRWRGRVLAPSLAAIALVLEVFGKSFGPPAILACGVTYLLTLKFKIYDAQRSSPSPNADETGG